MIISYPRFDFDTWVQIFGSEEFWENTQHPNDVGMFVMSTMHRCLETQQDIAEKLNKGEKVTLRIVTLDEEFMGWLIHRNIDPKEEEIQVSIIEEYMNSITNQDAIRLFRKGGMNSGHYFYYYPVIISSTHNINEVPDVPDKLQMRLKSAIRDVFGFDEIFIGDKLIDAGTIETCADEIENALQRKTSLDKWKAKVLFDDHENISFLCIPIAVRYSFDEPFFSFFDDENLRKVTTPEEYPLGPNIKPENDDVFCHFEEEIKGCSITFQGSISMKNPYDATKAELGFYMDLEKRISHMRDVTHKLCRIDKIHGNNGTVTISSLIKREEEHKQ